MKKSKSLFQDTRLTMGNHFDKALAKYYEYQNADKKQLDEIKGIKHYWK